MATAEVDHLVAHLRKVRRPPGPDVGEPLGQAESLRQVGNGGKVGIATGLGHSGQLGQLHPAKGSVLLDLLLRVLLVVIILLLLG